MMLGLSKGESLTISTRLLLSLTAVEKDDHPKLNILFGNALLLTDVGGFCPCDRSIKKSFNTVIPPSVCSLIWHINRFTDR